MLSSSHPAPPTPCTVGTAVPQGMEYLASKNIIHFDLKSGNLLLGYRDRRPVCKVADFGLSKQVGALAWAFGCGLGWVEASAGSGGVRGTGSADKASRAGMHAAAATRAAATLGKSECVCRAQCTTWSHD